MKSMIVVALALVAVSLAAPVDKDIQIVKSGFEQQPEGSYNFNYETSNGVIREEVGTLKTLQGEDNKPVVVVVVRGSYRYPDGNGGVETIEYTADENGYQAVGPSVPKAQRR